VLFIEDDCINKNDLFLIYFESIFDKVLKGSKYVMVVELRKDIVGIQIDKFEEDKRINFRFIPISISDKF